MISSNLDQRHCRTFIVTSGVETLRTEFMFRSPVAQLPLLPAHVHGLQVFLQLVVDVDVAVDDGGLGQNEMALYKIK